ncbi:MAG TPA: hypothetical protein VGN57_19775 [Pirellulaceae bacterium]|jgi:hypothetical protein|nr:hypothetical protein [Pirellulaceae bacterium]
MRIRSRRSANAAALALAVSLSAFAAGEALAQNQPVVPGTGMKIVKVGDDFEDPEWNFVHNYPKASHEMDEQVRHPSGYSTNRRWMESAKRGHPDYIVRVETPPGGIPGSQGALMLRTLYSGVPKRFTYKMQQDDFLMNCASKVGGNISVNQSPNFTTRVYLPPFEEWEQRTGVSLGIRAGCLTTKTTSGGGLFGMGSQTEAEEYWPGMFIQFHSVTDGKTDHDHAQVIVRSGPTGHDIFGPKIEQPGWWTFGMSFTPDGAVHYYAKPGIENLTANDRLTSQFPYGYRAKWFETVFFNVANMDDGRTWSTPWVVDDVSLYLANGSVAQR